MFPLRLRIENPLCAYFNKIRKSDDEGDGKFMYTKCARKRADDLNVKTNEMCMCSFNKQT